MGSDESHFNVSLTVRNKVTRQCPQTTTYEDKGEPKLCWPFGCPGLWRRQTSRSAAVVDATSGEGPFQESLYLFTGAPVSQWSVASSLHHSGQWPVLYTTVASGKLFTQRHLRQAVVLQPGDASCPAQLYLQEQGLDADGLRCGGSTGGHAQGGAGGDGRWPTTRHHQGSGQHSSFVDVDLWVFLQVVFVPDTSV